MNGFFGLFVKIENQYLGILILYLIAFVAKRLGSVISSWIELVSY